MSRVSFSNWKILVLAIIPLLFITAFIQLQSDALETRQSPEPGLPQPETEETEQPDSPDLDQLETTEMGSIPVITHLEIMDPNEAKKIGIRGYIKITLEPGTPDRIPIERGHELNITILLHFVSYYTNFTDTVVSLNPKSRYGVTVEKGLGNGRGVVKLNDIVSYYLSGTIKLEANQTFPVNMNIKIPVDFPIVSLPIYVVGISADVPIIHLEKGKIDV